MAQRKRRDKSKQAYDKERPLSQLQQLFIHHLSQDPKHNLAEAARQAGYTCKDEANYSKVGWALMNLPENVHVQQAYKKLADERWAKWANVTDDQIMHMLAVQAFAPRSRIMSIAPNGDLKVTPQEELWPEEEWLIDSYRVIALNDGSGDTIAVPKLVSRQNAVQMLAKAKGLFIERIRVDANITIEQARESLKGALAELAAPGVPGAVDSPTDPPGTPGT